MTRARINYWVDVAALASALLVFPTGIILLVRFHVGPDGAHRLVGLGLSRAAWIEAHRSAAIVMTAALAAHAQIHWRAIVARAQHWRRRSRGNAAWSDLPLYFAFAVVTIAAYAAWLILPERLHHPAIDLHNISGVILLTAVTAHVRRHFRRLIR